MSKATAFFIVNQLQRPQWLGEFRNEVFVNVVFVVYLMLDLRGGEGELLKLLE